VSSRAMSTGSKCSRGRCSAARDSNSSASESCFYDRASPHFT
jgi:hypothetical protein